MSKSMTIWANIDKPMCALVPCANGCISWDSAMKPERKVVMLMAMNSPWLQHIKWEFIKRYQYEQQTFCLCCLHRPWKPYWPCSCHSALATWSTLLILAIQSKELLISWMSVIKGMAACIICERAVYSASVMLKTTCASIWKPIWWGSWQTWLQSLFKSKH